MKVRVTILVLLVAAVMLTVVGSALAMEMTGVVTAVDMEKSTVTINAEKMNVSFDCETGSLLKGINVGDTVKLKYTEENGKKLATAVTRVAPMAPMK
jgi:Cu/Ag efflux protein CusF